MKNKSIKGIWKYEDKLTTKRIQKKVTLGEGNTRLVKLDDIYYKCEFDNPTGSVKDRSLAFQITKAVEQKLSQAVISSSGNAAISAHFYCKKAGIKLTVFVSPKINKKKLTKLEKLNCQVVVTKKPISESFKYGKKTKAYNLRQSKDKNAPIGYQTIAFELIKQIPQLDSIFIPVSSGTTFQGVYEGMQKLKMRVCFHAVQTQSNHFLAEKYDKEFTAKPKSIADAIIAKYTPRQEKIESIIKKTNGWGWVVMDQDIKKALKYLHLNKINCSSEAAACLAALRKAQKKGRKFKYPVCLLTGKYY